MVVCDLFNFCIILQLFSAHWMVAMLVHFVLWHGKMEIVKNCSSLTVLPHKWHAKRFTALIEFFLFQLSGSVSISNGPISFSSFLALVGVQMSQLPLTLFLKCVSSFQPDTTVLSSATVSGEVFIAGCSSWRHPSGCRNPSTVFFSGYLLHTNCYLFQTFMIG